MVARNFRPILRGAPGSSPGSHLRMRAGFVAYSDREANKFLILRRPCGARASKDAMYDGQESNQ